MQPTLEAPGGERTDTGYSNDLESLVRSRWPGLELTELGCPGESTGTMIAGGNHCAYPEGSQLNAADAFLRTHRNTRLVTIDLGFNDVSRCIDGSEVDSACVVTRLALIRQQLPTILSSLRAAAGPHVRFVGVGHYDPFLAAERNGGSGDSYATGTLRVIEQLNDLLRSVYSAYGMPMADVLTAFDGTTFDDPLDTGGQLAGAAQRTCHLTWMCTSAPLGPNLHPNDRGYRIIAQVIASSIGSDR